MTKSMKESLKDHTMYEKLKSIASQFIACLSTSFLFLDLGLAMNFSTIALPVLLHAKEGLSLTNSQASWFGSIAYLAQPIGALFSGPTVEYFGLKKAIFLVNIPHVIAWPLMYSAWNVPSLLTANALMGLGTGIMESPINSYIGEISEPSTRAAISTTMQMFVSTGTLVVYYLGTVISWRTAALICLATPIASMLLVFFTPESPVRLLVSGNDVAALKCLRVLRGWTTEANVKEEFDKLSEYSVNLKRCVICDFRSEESLECEHDQMNIIKRTILKLRYVVLCKQTLRPLLFVILYFAFFVASGIAPIKPNMVNVAGAFGMAQNGKDIVVNVGLVSLLTGIFLILILKIVGRRKLAISTMFLTAVFTTCLSVYGRNNLDENVFSYNPETYPEIKSNIPLAFFYMMAIFSSLSIHWILFAEVFPFRSRATAQGIAAAGHYVINFIASKTFINLETSIHLWGTFAVYASLGFFGSIYLYLYLPETEGKSLQEIESYYSGESRIFADDPFINLFRRCRRKTVSGKLSSPE